MAEIVSNLVAGFLANLGSYTVKALLQGAKQLSDVKEEIQNLQDTFITINAVLVDAEEKQANNEQVRVWLQRLRDVLYDVEDLLDEFFTVVLQSKVKYGDDLKARVKVFFSRKNQLLYNYLMTRKLKDIRKKLDAVAEDRSKFHLQEGRSRAEAWKRKPSHSIRRQTYIGREKDEQVIINFLLQSDDRKKVSTIALVGHGGMGKTALAQKIFNSSKLAKCNFDFKIWVCVSDNFDIQAVVNNILESIADNKVESLQMDTLMRQLMSKIERKKYLLILDDLWNEDRNRWCDLEDLLMHGEEGSKVMVTTRTNKVAKAIGATYIHKLEGLSREESWTLFEEAAFAEREESKNQTLVNIGKKIAEKCHGIPLVILTIGRIYIKSVPKENGDCWRKKKFQK